LNAVQDLAELSVSAGRKASGESREVELVVAVVLREIKIALGYDRE
jgi:hypothetical protein